MVTGNMYRKFGKIWTCGFSDMRSERQTNRQTDRQTIHTDMRIAILEPQLVK